MQNNQSIMQISENKDGSAKVLFRIRKAEMADVDEIMAVMHEAKNDKEHPDWFVSDDEEYVRTHIEEQGFVIVAQTADGSVAGFFLIKYPENREDNLGTYLDFDEEFFMEGIRHLNKDAPVFKVCGKTGEGYDAAAEWLMKISKK